MREGEGDEETGEEKEGREGRGEGMNESYNTHEKKNHHVITLPTPLYMCCEIAMYNAYGLEHTLGKMHTTCMHSGIT